MYNRLLKYLHKKPTLFSNQYGFWRKHSTKLATIELITKISQAIARDNNEYTVSIFRPCKGIWYWKSWKSTEDNWPWMN